MTKRFYLGLFIAALLILLAAAALERAPGYMDADYYYAGGLRLASGQGATEPYLWNYLNDPAASSGVDGRLATSEATSAALPAPSFSYWMPLASLLAAAGLALAQPLGLWAARAGFILLAACVPPLTALISFELTRRPSHARLAGLLALFPGFYLAYLPTTDAFPIYMVLGSLFLLLSFGDWAWLPLAARLFALGLLAGLLHLTRADGVLWLAAALGVALVLSRGPNPPAPFPKGKGEQETNLQAPVPLEGTPPPLGEGPGERSSSLPAREGGERQEPKDSRSFRRHPSPRGGGVGGEVLLLLFPLAGYVLVMAPWFARNLQAWGGLFPPGGSRAIWITAYEQTMIYPAGLLTPQHWLSAGWGAHFEAWLNALSNNFQTALAVQGSILLFPFILAGLWKLRACPPVRLGAGMWLLTAGVMTVVFPFAGANGGFFHSGAAVQPLLWAAVPAGVESFVAWYARLRRLSWPQGMLRFVSVLVVVVCALLSGMLYFQRVAGSKPGEWKWNASAVHYQQVERALRSFGAEPGDSVLVNNPPGFWLASGRPAVVVPFGDEQMLLAAARRYNIRYLVLEQNDSRQLYALYVGLVRKPELEFLTSVGTTRLYRIVPQP